VADVTPPVLASHRSTQALAPDTRQRMPPQAQQQDTPEPIQIDWSVQRAPLATDMVRTLATPASAHESAAPIAAPLAHPGWVKDFVNGPLDKTTAGAAHQALRIRLPLVPKPGIAVTAPGLR